MAIRIVTGEPGSGKTYLMTKLVLRALRAKRSVWTNYSIHWPEKNYNKFTNIEFFLTLEKGLVGLDEIHRYFDARNWAKFPDWAKAKFNQHRHDGLDVIGSCQWFGQIDKNVRLLTVELIDCEKVKRFGKHWVVARHYKRVKSLKSLRYYHRYSHKTWHLINPAIYNRYDTTEKISATAYKKKWQIKRFQ